PFTKANHKEPALRAPKKGEGEAGDRMGDSLSGPPGARRFSGRMGQRLDSLDALARAAALRPDGRLRDEAIAAMAVPDVRFGPSCRAWPPGNRMWNVDGQYHLYACANDKGGISIRSLPDGREVQTIVSAPTRREILRLSPDGRYVANLEDGDTLKVWRVADRQAVLREAPRQTFGWAFSPNSRQLVVGQQGWILRFDLAAGKELNRWQLPEKM